MNWNYGYHQSAGEPVTTAHKDHQLGPASDVLVVSCHLRRCEMLQLSFCWHKKISQLGYHPSFPAYGALPPRVSGSTWHFQAGLITHLPSQICARQTSGAAPKPGQLSWYRFVDEQSTVWRVNIRKAAQKSGCWSCSRNHKPKTNVSVAFRPRLALTRLVRQKTIRVFLLSSRVEWTQKLLRKFVALLIFLGCFNQHCAVAYVFPKGPAQGCYLYIEGKNYFLHYNS